MLKNLKMLKNMLCGNTLLCLWQVTGRCNFRCRICNFWREEHSVTEELTLAQAALVVERFKPVAPIMISLAGGEPLLRDDLEQLVALVARDHFCSVITNGWLMTPQRARQLYAAGMQDVMVSIDYATPARHDQQRGMPGAFAQAVSAIETLRDLCPSNAHKVRILTVLLNDNLEEIEGLLLLAEELSVSLALTLYSDHRGKKEPLFPEPPVSDYLLELKRRHRCFDSASAYLASFDQALTSGVSGCGGGRTFININCRGQISRCIDSSESPCADPLQQSLDEIHSALQLAQQDDCQQCWTSCRGLADVLTGVQGIRHYGEFARTRR